MLCCVFFLTKQSHFIVTITVKLTQYEESGGKNQLSTDTKIDTLNQTTLIPAARLEKREHTFLLEQARTLS